MFVKSSEMEEKYARFHRLKHKKIISSLWFIPYMWKRPFVLVIAFPSIKITILFVLLLESIIIHFGDFTIFAKFNKILFMVWIKNLIKLWPNLNLSCVKKVYPIAGTKLKKKH